MFDNGGIEELFYNPVWGLLEKDFRNKYLKRRASDDNLHPNG
jgi:hypothetical protein